MENKYTVLLIFFILLISCQGEDSNKNQLLEDDIAKLEKEVDELTIENENLRISLENHKTINEVLQEENNYLNFKLSPLGVHLGEFSASNDNEYKFGKDSMVVLAWEEGEYMIGTWFIKNDTVKINYFKKIGKKGIGEPLPAPEVIPGNYVDRYEEYKEYVKSIDENEYLIWGEVRSLLEKDPEYPYQLLNRYQDFDLKSFDKELTEN